MRPEAVVRNRGPSSFLRNSSIALGFVALFLLTPFSVNNFVNGRLLLGVGSLVIVIALAVNAWTVARSGRYYPEVSLYGLMPAIIFFLTLSIQRQGIIGVLWCFPAVLACYVMLPERKAWIANMALLGVVIPIAWSAIDTPVAMRMVATLTMVSVVTAVFVRIITDQQNTLEEKIEELEASEQRALAASHAKSLFLANMSHELRTPLNGVLGYAQLLARRRRNDPEVRDAMTVILRSGEHLLRLINDVLSISKIEAGRVRLEEKPFALWEMLQEIEGTSRVRAEAEGLEMVSDIDSSLPRAVTGDAGRLRQILVNLLGNAIKFTESGTVTLRARWSDGRGRFDVEDTGPGIAGDEMEHLFERFLQTESGLRSEEGTGLGLALSRDLARMMGGDITVESAVGVGSRFRVDVSLPVAPADSLPRVVARSNVVELAPGQPVYRILVVDDVETNRTLLAGILRSVGFEVREAVDGGEAVTAWREFEPDLIWMDKRMPGIDGLEATRRIREEERATGRRVRILALSAGALDHERSAILEAGCDDFVAKPFDEATIFEKMAEVLGVRYLSEMTGESEASADSGPRMPAAGSSAAIARAHVLLVDDDPISREVAREILEQAGFRVTPTAGGEEALRFLEPPVASDVDLVLTDLHMPSMDGIEAARRIKAIPGREKLPVIAMTAHSADEVAAEIAASVIDDHVGKPVEPEALVQTVRRWLNR